MTRRLLASACTSTLLAFTALPSTAQELKAALLGAPTVDIRAERLSAQPAGLLLGMHALWWDMPGELWAKATRSSPISTLLRKTGGVLRYGGGANEVDWTVCGQPAVDRRKVKVVDWSGPMACDFGWPEYTNLALDAGRGTAWLIANVVGSEGREFSDAEMAAKVSAGATRLRELAPGATRYWELGNELERGKVRWAAERIAKRLGVAADAIRAADPQARPVFPLTEFDPVPGITRAAFNRMLLAAAGKQFNEFALHQYYEGAPAGPRVSTQLANLKEVAAQAKAAVGGDVSLWLTEHARWPAGSPADPTWKSNWGQTNSMDGVLATADYLIGLSQIPEVSGAMLHGVHAGPWSIVQTGAGGAKLTGVGWLLDLFSQSSHQLRLKTELKGASMPSGWSPYSARLAAFERTDASEYSIWAVNRDERELVVDVQSSGQSRALVPIGADALRCSNGAADCPSDGVQREELPIDTAWQVDAKGQAHLLLPPRSVIVLRFRWR